MRDEINPIDEESLKLTSGESGEQPGPYIEVKFYGPSESIESLRRRIAHQARARGIPIAIEEDGESASKASLQVGPSSFTKNFLTREFLVRLRRALRVKWKGRKVMVR